MQSDGEESGDVHTCGKCREVFTDLIIFLEHKRSHIKGSQINNKLCPPICGNNDVEECVELDSRLMNSPIVDVALPDDSHTMESGVASELASAAGEATDDCFPYKCQHCFVRFGSERSLQEHLTMTHLTGMTSSEHKYSTVRTVYSCSVCNARFKSKFEMETHERSHDKAKGFLCSYPEFTISSSTESGELGHEGRHNDPNSDGNSILRHEERHSEADSGGDPRFLRCVQCLRTFRGLGALHRHMQSQTCSRRHGSGAMFAAGHTISDNQNDSVGRSGLLCGSLGSSGQQSDRHSEFMKISVISREVSTAEQQMESTVSSEDETKPFPCSYPTCTFAFKTKGSQVRHERRHTDSRPFKCSECSRTFRESGALSRHRKSQIPCTQKRDADFPMYGKKKPLPGQTIPDNENDPIKSDLMCESLLTIERRIHGIMDNVETPEVSSASKDDQHEAEIGYAIVEASREKVSEGELDEREEEVDNTEEILAQSGGSGDGGEVVVADYFRYCQLCNEMFEDESLLKNHLRDHLSEGVFLCEQCPFIAPDRNLLTAHTTHTHAIPQLGTGLEYMGSERVYDASCIEQLRTVNPQQAVREAIQAVQQLLILENASPDATVGELTNQILTLRYIRKCPACDRQFKTASLLKQHIRTHTGERPYRCKHCPKDFPTKDTFKKHSLCHSNERSYRCGECGKLFKRISHAKEHLKTHSHLRPYQCQICLKSFKTMTIYKVHERSHSGHFPWICKVCNKKFREKASLTRHIRTHTGEKPFECEYCRKRFSEHGTLARHIRAKMPCSEKLSLLRNRQTYDEITEVDGQTYTAPTEVEEQTYASSAEVDEQTYSAPAEEDLTSYSIVDAEKYPSSSALVQFCAVVEDGQEDVSTPAQITSGDTQPSFPDDPPELKTLEMTEDADGGTYFLVDGELVELQPGAPDNNQQGQIVRDEEHADQHSHIIFITDDFIV